MEDWCSHMVLMFSLFYDAAVDPDPDRACKSCQNCVGELLCVCCKNFFCRRSLNKHMHDQFEKTNHCVAIDWSTKSIHCCYCFRTLDGQVFRQLCINGGTGPSLSKLKSIDAVIDNVKDILAKPFPSIGFQPQFDTKLFEGQDDVEFVKNGLDKIIFDCGLKALADLEVRKVFLHYTSKLLEAKLCPSDIKPAFSSFICNISEKISAYIQAIEDLNSAWSLSSSIRWKIFLVQQQTLMYHEVKNKMLASDENITNSKAKITMAEALLKGYKNGLPIKESSRAKIDEAIVLIEKNVTTARDELVSDLAQLCLMEKSIQACEELINKMDNEWNNLGKLLYYVG